jgi:hypothetical protein
MNTRARSTILATALSLLLAACVVERCEWTPDPEATPGAATEASTGEED